MRPHDFRTVSRLNLTGALNIREFLMEGLGPSRRRRVGWFEKGRRASAHESVNIFVHPFWTMFLALLVAKDATSITKGYKGHHY